MQGKGIVKFLLVALSLISIYQLSFTWFASNADQNLKEQAKSSAELRSLIDSIQDEKIIDLGLTSYTYKECKEQQLNLGLDLQGGMNVTMEVAVEDVIKSLSGNSVDPDFVNSMRTAQEKQKNSQEDFVTLFIQSWKETTKSDNSLFRSFATLENKGKITPNSTDKDVEQWLRGEAESSIARAFDILRTRIDKFGVVQPNIQRMPGTGRIVVELPGVDDPERVRKLLQAPAKLAFWETFENAEIVQKLIDIDKMLGDQNKASAKLDSAEGTTVAVTDTNSLLNQIKSEGDTSKLSAALQNPLFAVLQPAIQNNAQGSTAIQGPVVGYALVKDTAKVMALFAQDKVKALLPRNLKLFWTVKPPKGAEKPFLQLVAIKTRGSETAPLEGDAITNARGDIDQFGQNEVLMGMNTEGSKNWRKLTADNVGKSIAIVLDNYVYSYPTVRQEIAGGNSSISGDFTNSEAKDLANILGTGKLPAPARIIEEAVVGPSLGQDAINKGLMSFVIGFIAVMLFMGLYYKKAGWIANIALLFNIFLVFGVLASFNAVLTLPGIAGIVLTMGMAVDANVLIYERVREELQAGVVLKQAIPNGYNGAYSTILDSNITTILTALILFIFGSGPIRGFATTLMIGILCSLFSALFIPRIIFEYLVNKGKDITFFSDFTAKLFSGININFLKKRKIMYAISIGVILIGIASMVMRGFSLGVDFKGGRSYVVQTNANTEINSVREGLKTSFENSPEIKTYGSEDKFEIKTADMIDDQSTQADQIVEQKLYAGLKTIIPAGTDFDTFRKVNIVSTRKVGPTIVDDIKTDAIKSIIYALLVIALYIFIRFRRWQYSLGAAVSLAHDVLIVLGVFSLLWGFLPFNMDVDQAFIAAVLTIIGYSINDTVVVYDRLRHYLKIGDFKHLSLEDVITDAVNKTLSRTILTASTVIIVAFVLFIFAGDVIRGFTFALLVGLLTGTYSSIFIASAIVYDFGLKKIKVENSNSKA